MEKNKNKKVYKIVSIILIAIMIFMMFHDANKQSFWVDELDSTIEYISLNNFREMFYRLLTNGYNLPLSYIIYHLIYKIVPYGEVWLLWPNFIMIILGIIILFKLGKKLGGDNLAYPILWVSIASYYLMYQGAFELRPYACLFLFSSWALYNLVNILEDRNKKNVILYTVSLILLAYSHWFGCLIIPFYFICELVLWLRKKQKISFIIPYIITGLTFLPWAILLLINHKINFTEYWAGKPTFNTIINTIHVLLSNNMICIILFFIGVLIFLINVALKNSKETKYIGICVGSILWTIGTIFLYSRYINPTGSLYVDRYFLVLLPHIFLIMSLPLKAILNFKLEVNSKPISINNIYINEKILGVIVIYIVSIVCIQNYLRVYNEIRTIYEPYREVSNMVAYNNDIYSNDSAFVVSAGYGYLTYYFEKQGYSLPTNVYYGTSKIYQIVKNGKRIDRETYDFNTLLKYENLYLFSVQEYFSEDFWNFISKNYKLVAHHSGYEYYHYVKNEEIDEEETSQLKNK